MRIFPDYPIEKSQYPINKKISGYYPIHQNFLSGALYKWWIKWADEDNILLKVFKVREILLSNIFSSKATWLIEAMFQMEAVLSQGRKAYADGPGQAILKKLYVCCAPTHHFRGG